MSDKKEGRGIFWPATFAVGAIGLAYGIFSLPDGTEKCGSEALAYVMSQEPVRGFLNSPNTADFPSIAEKGVSVERIDECRFQVSAYVDAQNSFGTMIRTPYRATMTTNGTGWSASGVHVGD